MSRPAIFLDRDNTIIRNDGDLGDPDGVELMPTALEALASLHSAGWPLIVITNQGGVARGRYGEDDVRAVHARTQALLGAVPILDWLWCPFHPTGTVPRFTREHPWRKPAPGMLLEAANRHDLDLTRSWLIGDQDRDIAAGLAVGCRSVLLGAAAGDPPPDVVAQTMQEAADAILGAPPL
ncbi:MAG: HAD family hydrolase [Planctomycetes bacterium]|jgi:histidinol-phosphate phosphatase family protein|nr:HAD family hydrolase [Planctomycetota bacterium]MCP4837836.1 HAD family hydrolase [Planctomycetota bacterium]